MNGASLAIDVDKVRDRGTSTQADAVAVEEPLEIQLCQASADNAAARSISVTMRTPGHDDELALGFLLSEGLIASADDVLSVAHVGPVDAESGTQNTIRVELAASVNVDLDRLTRHFYTTSSCGVCGKASLDALRAVLPPAPDDSLRIDRSTLVSLPGRLAAEQQVFASTGGLHAAAAFDPSGRLVVVREDVGRHNAVDKVVGALLANDSIPASGLGLLVSGRASFELTQKAAMAGIPLLAAVSAPSSLAVRLARELGMTLVGFLRGERYNIYSGPERLEG